MSERREHPPERTAPPVLAVLCSGGDAPGMNAAIAAFATEAAQAGATTLAVRDGFAGLADRRLEPLSRAAAQRARGEAGTWLGTSRHPALAEPDGRAACLAALAGRGVTGLAVLGGDGSLAGARALAGLGPAIAFVPATIDGDVDGSGTALGLDSAVRHACDAIACLRATGRALGGRAFVVETLGGPSPRLAAAVAAAADVALRAEPDAAARVVVMHEGAGDAVAVAARLGRLTGLRVHATVLGHAQRGATPTPGELRLGEAAGRAAAGALLAGRSAFVALSSEAAPVLLPLEAAPAVA